MFKFDPNPQFTHDVTVSEPVDDGFTEARLRTRFNALPVAKLQEMETNLMTHEGQEAFLQAVVATFEDLVDGENTPLRTTPEIRAALLQRPWVRKALLSHYPKAIMGEAGRDGERAKN